MTADRLVILGASGDLTGRYLLPALCELSRAGLLEDGLGIVGVARDDWDDATFRAHAADRLRRHASHLPDGAHEDIVARLRYRHGDATDAETLRAAVADAQGSVLAYLALPPSVFPAAVRGLAAAGIPDGSRVVVEKPFGTDLTSARELNALLHQYFPEEAVFRIDHFLGEQTVQNVLGLRFANRLFEPLWCGEHVAAVDIVWDETIALEGRAGYYDQTGALRDMVQNHLLQLLAFISMERPDGLGAGPLRDAKVDVLRAVRTLDDEAVRSYTMRGRYTAGVADARPILDYTAEPGVEPARRTETFAEVVLWVDNDRWRGVPFRLRTGKALARDLREMRVRFRPVARLAFGDGDEPGPNVLTMTMHPDRLLVDIALNGAGDPFRLEPARIALDLAPQELSAYARLLVDALEGDPAFSTRGDEAEESWRIVDPVVAAWNRDVTPLLPYPAGSAGPTR